MKHGRITPGYGAGQGESFERYYLRNVLSEGCNCAELVVTENAGGPKTAGGGILAALLQRLLPKGKRPSRKESGEG